MSELGLVEGMIGSLPERKDKEKKLLPPTPIEKFKLSLKRDFVRNGISEDLRLAAGMFARYKLEGENKLLKSDLERSKAEIEQLKKALSKAQEYITVLETNAGLKIRDGSDLTDPVLQVFCNEHAGSLYFPDHPHFSSLILTRDPSNKDGADQDTGLICLGKVPFRVTQTSSFPINWKDKLQEANLQDLIFLDDMGVKYVYAYRSLMDGWKACDLPILTEDDKIIIHHSEAQIFSDSKTEDSEKCLFLSHPHFNEICVTLSKKNSLNGEEYAVYKGKYVDSLVNGDSLELTNDDISYLKLYGIRLRD